MRDTNRENSKHAKFQGFPQQNQKQMDLLDNGTGGKNGN